MPDSASILGALRERIQTDAALLAAIPGRCHTNELPADVEQPYPAVVFRYPRTRFGWFTAGTAGAKERIEKPQVEIWVECLRAEQGEAIGRMLIDRLTDEALPYSAGEVVQVFPQDLWLAPEVGRNQAGLRQYSWCLLVEAWFQKTTA